MVERGLFYKGSLYYIYFKLSGLPTPHITTKEYNTMLKVFDVVSTIYDKYKPLPFRFETNINNEGHGSIC